MGCDTLLASGFAYNGDNNDEIQFGGYGLNPPMQNVVVLRGMEADAGDGIDNDLDGMTDEPGERTTMNHFISADGPNNSPIGNPNGDLDHYYYMQSTWLDGLPLSYGSDGRDQTAPLTNFMFSGTPYTSQWNESSVGNPPEERKYVLGSGPVSLPSGGEITIDFAYVFTWDSLSPNGVTTSIARNIEDVQRVHSWFNNDNFPSCLIYSVGTEELLNENQQLRIYPNPASSVISIKISESIVGIEAYRIKITEVLSREILVSEFKNQLNISELENGIYFFSLYRDHQLIETKKIMKE